MVTDPLLLVLLSPFPDTPRTLAQPDPVKKWERRGKDIPFKYVSLRFF